ncbi:MAG: dockerin type I repeat-containing protein, partial [Muribaculaceae bacterium]|nr:dockerin type I repeat-containing protein [Muribaculaceae bacterium]
QYYVVVWSPYFPNNYDWNWFFNDPVPFTVGNWVTPPDPQFLLGDVDGDGKVSITDVTALIDLLLGDGTYVEAGDMNGDGALTITDVTDLIDLLLAQPAE